MNVLHNRVYVVSVQSPSVIFSKFLDLMKVYVQICLLPLCNWLLYSGFFFAGSVVICEFVRSN